MKEKIFIYGVKANNNLCLYNIVTIFFKVYNGIFSSSFGTNTNYLFSNNWNEQII